jgi:hypothetical protein
MTAKIAAIALFVAILAGCSRSPAPPDGRWEGVYETKGTIVAARVEILDGGMVRLSAPYVSNAANASPERREQIRASLAGGLGAGWTYVKPRRFEFDGRIFRKPGGIAPQMEWNAHERVLSIVLYIGTQPSFRVPVHQVEEFSDDPFEPAHSQFF